MKRIDYIIMIATVIVVIIIVIIFTTLTEDILPSWLHVCISIIVGSLISVYQDDMIYYVKRRLKIKDE